MLTVKFKLLNKGIVANVTLDGRILTNWTSCLTNNFIPSYQQNVNVLNDFFSKYMNIDRYLTNDKLKSVKLISKII